MMADATVSAAHENRDSQNGDDQNRAAYERDEDRVLPASSASNAGGPDLIVLAVSCSQLCECSTLAAKERGGAFHSHLETTRLGVVDLLVVFLSLLLHFKPRFGGVFLLATAPPSSPGHMLDECRNA
jgi:hypothetical protein